MHVFITLIYSRNLKPEFLQPRMDQSVSGMQGSHVVCLGGNNHLRVFCDGKCIAMIAVMIPGHKMCVILGL